jgi:hypothetical protein
MTARHEDRKARQMCERCRDRKARFQYRGQVRADREHTLCFECYRSERDRQHAHRLSAIDPSGLASPFGVRPALSDREIDHRRRMLAHLRRSVAAS